MLTSLAFPLSPALADVSTDASTFEAQSEPVLGAGEKSIPKAAPKATPEAAQEAVLVARIVTLVNKERTSRGLAPVRANPLLARAAQAHANDMAQRDYFSHNSLDGRTYDQRVEKTGYTYSAIGENIAAGGATAESTMRQWMNSPGHRANILSPDFKEIGVGHTYASASRYGHTWVQDFGTRM